jgi:hypothetical protein
MIKILYHKRKPNAINRFGWRGYVLGIYKNIIIKCG